MGGGWREGEREERGRGMKGRKERGKKEGKARGRWKGLIQGEEINMRVLSDSPF